MGTTWGAHTGEQLGRRGFSLCIQRGHPHSGCLYPDSQSLTGVSQHVPRLVLCPLGFLIARHARDSISVCQTWWVLPGHCCSRRLPAPGQNTPAPACALGVPTTCRTCPSARRGQRWAPGDPPVALWGASTPAECPPRVCSVGLSLPGHEEGTCAPGTGMCWLARWHFTPDRAHERASVQPLLPGQLGAPGASGCRALVAARCWLHPRGAGQCGAVPAQLGIKTRSRALPPGRAGAGKDPGSSARPG